MKEGILSKFSIPIHFLWVSGLQYVNTWSYSGAHKNRKIIYKKEGSKYSLFSSPLHQVFFYDFINICKTTLGFIGRKEWKDILSSKWYSLTFATNIPRKFEFYWISPQHIYWDSSLLAPVVCFGDQPCIYLITKRDYLK